MPKLQLTSPNGGTLNTAGTYCDSDIEIIPKLQSKTVTENGTVTADDGFAGLGEVVVDVESGGGSSSGGGKSFTPMMGIVMSDLTGVHVERFTMPNMTNGKIPLPEAITNYMTQNCTDENYFLAEIFLDGVRLHVINIEDSYNLRLDWVRVGSAYGGITPLYGMPTKIYEKDGVVNHVEVLRVEGVCNEDFTEITLTADCSKFTSDGTYQDFGYPVDFDYCDREVTCEIRYGVINLETGEII